MYKKHYYFMDYVRILGFFLIVSYHFMVELELKNIYVSFKKWLPIYYANNNLQWGMFGVSMFFIISGMGLMLSTKDKFVCKEYYIKRFTKIMIPYYIVWTFSLLFSYNFCKELFQSFIILPKWKLILNLFGMDGYFMNVTPTMYMCVGEWFLGALINFYILFPLLRMLMLKNRYLFFGIATASYLIFVNVYTFPFFLPWMNIFVKMYDFIIGIFLALELEKFFINERKHLFFTFLTLFIILFGLIYPYKLPIHIVICNMIYAVAIIVFLMSIEKYLKKCTTLSKAIGWLCKYSYELFLVHHFIIYFFIKVLMKESPVLNAKGVLILAFVEGVIMMINAFGLHNFTNFLQKFHH